MTKGKTKMNDELTTDVTMLKNNVNRLVADLDGYQKRTAMLERTLAQFFVITIRRGGTWRSDIRMAISGLGDYDEPEREAIRDMVADMQAKAENG